MEIKMTRCFAQLVQPSYSSKVESKEYTTIKKVKSKFVKRKQIMMTRSSYPSPTQKQKNKETSQSNETQNNPTDENRSSKASPQNLNNIIMTRSQVVPNVGSSRKIFSTSSEDLIMQTLRALNIPGMNYLNNSTPKQTLYQADKLAGDEVIDLGNIEITNKDKTSRDNSAGDIKVVEVNTKNHSDTTHVDSQNKIKLLPNKTMVVKEPKTVHTFKKRCPTCGKRFVRKDRFTSHINKISKCERRCYKCGKKFYTNQDFKRHKSDKCNLERKCQICDKLFDSNRNLAKHEQNKKNCERKCLKCIFEFKRPSELKEHKKKSKDCREIF